jgi:hypothetical protein
MASALLIKVFMIQSVFVASRFRRALLSVAGCLALGPLAASCQRGQGVCPSDARSGTIVYEHLTDGRTGQIDILLVIDNSRSMADKQQILAVAVPDIVQGIVNPPCLDHDGKPVSPRPEGPFESCPRDTARKVDPLLDVHVGIISTSIGGHGSDACSTAGTGKQSNNDKAHLLARKDPTMADEVQTYQGLKFLAWDPDQQLEPPGEADILGDDETTTPDANHTALVPTLRDMVLGVGQLGCGYEAQLESWYRFLVDPSPPDEVTLDSEGRVLLKGTDQVLLDQRRAFLRPDSLLAIILLTDENDCSIRESGQFYFAAQQKSSNGSPFHLPKARAICDQNPSDACCFSCGQSGPKDDSGNLKCDADPSCKTADGKTVYLNELEDNINLRCLNQKRRFGIDFLYDTDRYVNALRYSDITDRNGEVVPNPIFSDLDPNDNNNKTRTSNLVFFAGIVGVPWQDIARTNGSGVPDLEAGLDPENKPVGGFKNADEMVAPLPGKDYNTWDLILGDPDNYPDAEALPKDPLMRESVEPRSGFNPVTGDPIAVPSSAPGTNKINGHEYSIPMRDDLQYACIFPLVKVDAQGNTTPDTRDCSASGLAACDCEDPMNDNPLCDVNAGSGKPTNQVRAKAYPGLRELQVLKDAGWQGIVASVCPAQIDEPGAADFGYRPAISSILNRLTPLASGQCWQTALHADGEGRVTCNIIEAGYARADGTCCDATKARLEIPQEHKPLLDTIQGDSRVGGYDCFCEIPQLSGQKPDEPLWACQNDPSKVPFLENGDPVDGYCYIDTAAGIGNPEVVSQCPDTEKRILRFVGAGAPRWNRTLFIACSTAPPAGENAGCE